MRYIEKQVVLQTLDHLWREHLVTLDHLRQVIGWRGMAQRDPLNEYKSEAFDLFGELIKHLREQTTAQLNHVEVDFEEPPPPLQTAQFEALHPPAEALAGLAPDFGNEAPRRPMRPCRRRMPNNVPRGERQANDPSTWGKIGRNEPCPCGSGKKYQALPRGDRVRAFSGFGVCTRSSGTRPSCRLARLAGLDPAIQRFCDRKWRLDARIKSAHDGPFALRAPALCLDP